MQHSCVILLFFFIASFFEIHAMEKKCEIQGHRGYRGRFPENTLPAFEAAIEAQADVLEMDLLLTGNEYVVIYHDYFINPALIVYQDKRSLTSQGPLVRSLTLAQVKEFDCGIKNNPDFPGQRRLAGTQIPTLQELFTLIHTSTHPHAKKIRLNLEIKRETLLPELTLPPAVIVDTLLRVVRASGLSKRISYSSFDPEVLFELRKKEPKARIAFLQENTSTEAMNDILKNMVAIASQLGAEIVSPEASLIHDVAQIRYLQQLGFKVVLWTVNDPLEWKKFINMGVDGLITDYPAELRTYLR
jgi:glycerophosphoryl diester phosphodiesterase